MRKLITRFGALPKRSGGDTLNNKPSSKSKKLLTSLLILMTSLLILAPFSSTTVHAQEDTGVGVRAVRPRITEIQLEHNFGTHHLYFDVFDLNSWRHVSQVSVEFYRRDELVRHYVFNQTRDLQRSIEVRRGDGLVDFESHSSELRETVDQRCTLSFHFQFSGINYDRLTIRAVDHAGGMSESTINFHGITTGRTITVWLLPILIIATTAVIYKTVKETGGKIDEG